MKKLGWNINILSLLALQLGAVKALTQHQLYLPKELTPVFTEEEIKVAESSRIDS